MYNNVLFFTIDDGPEVESTVEQMNHGRGKVAELRRTL